MRMLMRGGLALALVAVGYFLGSSGALEFRSAQAQQQQQEGLDDETQEKLKTAHEALLAAREALVTEGRYNPATEGMNTFAITTGGVDAVADLESGRGVDPETFAALYADLAIADIRPHLGRDAQGRMTYKNKVIRMYPIARLKQAFQDRDRLVGIEEN